MYLNTKNITKNLPKKQFVHSFPKYVIHVTVLAKRCKTYTWFIPKVSDLNFPHKTIEFLKNLEKFLHVYE